MKKIFLCLILSTALSFAGENEIKVKSKITGATVFLSGAQITNEGSTTIPAGTSEIVFENLPSAINKNTIQAKGEGNFSILSVVHRINYISQSPKPKELLVLEDSLEILNSSIQLQEALRNVYANEEAMLIANKSIGGENTGVTALELEKVATLMRNRLIDLANKKLEIQTKEKKLRESVSRISVQIQEINAGRSKTTSEIVITVSAKAPTPAKLEVSYLIYNAGWIPAYDIRAKDSNSPIALTFKGKVYQSSGFDWKNIKITLSTGNPNLSGSKPVLNPWWLQFYNQYAKNKKGSGRYSEAAPAMADELNSIETVEYSRSKASGALAKPEIAKSSSEYVYTEETQTTTEYNIDIPYNIPSDGKEYIVEIQNLSIPAMYSYYCAPKIDNDAFLLAKITGWDKYNLMSGEANIFFEGTYVGKSYFNTLSTTDTLDISLGRDKNVVVSRTKLVDFSEKKIIGLNKKETATYEISIRNKKKEAIEIQIDDQIPLSSNNEIIVEGFDTGKAEHNKENGKLTWKMNIPAAETQKVKFSYTVKYPKDKVISNL